jgi:hypothetical protein
MNSLTALIVPVPEAAPAVDPFRQEYDWSARHGLGPHITVLLPFIERTLVGSTDLTLLRGLFAVQRPIKFELANANRFERYVYLEPVPREPFIELTNQVLAAYPLLKPYGGMFAYEGVIPHLTVAYHDDDSVLDRISSELRYCRVNALARTVVLMECRDDWWHPIDEFPLGQR